MANINDYLLWRGDLPMNRVYPFNEIDSMILSRFSYLRFDKIKLLAKESIASVSRKMRELSNDEFLYDGDKELITYLGNSSRFNQMVVTDYVKMDDKNSEKQFGAVTVHISEKEMYVSFLGTDSMIVGWKEDFNIEYIAGRDISQEYIDSDAVKLAYLNGIHLEEKDLFDRDICYKFLKKEGIIDKGKAVRKNEEYDI